MVKGEDNQFVKFRKLENYKSLKTIKDTIYTKLKELYEDNVWKLRDNVEILKEYYQDTNDIQEISWKNEIQYLDYPPNTKLNYNKISLEAFKKGEYKSKYTLDKRDNSITTEERYAKRLIFYTKNLPTFRKYEGNDNIEWVVKDNRILFYEIMKYHNDKNNTISSLQGDIKAMMRAILLLLGDNTELRYKYPILSTDLKYIERLNEDQNKVQSKNEVNTFVPYEQLLDIIDELEDDYNKNIKKLPKGQQKEGKYHSNELFNKHQILLALTLNVLDFPSRNEKFSLGIVKDENDIKDDGNYVKIGNKNCKLIFGTEKKKHKPISYILNNKAIEGLNKRLTKLLMYSYKTYPRNVLFISKLGWEKQDLKKVAPETVSEWLRELIPNKNIGINGMRSSFVSYWYDKFNNYQKQILKTRMRTSNNEIQRNYYKKYNTPDELIKVKIEPTEEDDNEEDNIEIQPKGLIQIKEKPKPENIHERKKTNFKKYYDDPLKREKHLERVRKYNNTELTVAKRYIRELQKGLLDFDRLQQNTKDKYGLFVKDGKYGSSKL